MDPLLTLDCQAILPDRFGLVLAAAARTRTLREGDRPRLEDAPDSNYETAFREIAAGVFTAQELRPFLPARAPHRLMKAN